MRSHVFIDYFCYEIFLVSFSSLKGESLCHETVLNYPQPREYQSTLITESLASTKPSTVRLVTISCWTFHCLAMPRGISSWRVRQTFR